MNITLDSIRAAADAKYGSFDIDLGDGNVVRLLNPLRLSTEKRAELKAAQAQLGDDTDDDVDQAELFENLIRVVAQSPAQADALLTLVDHDLAILAELFSEYGDNTQAGEASASAI